eukprot:Seg1541.1 transcript_id=Seg1541.1/GoldUCD/mRNA.D3Y31 product="Tyrosine-protein kinase CSK" protein_id=Seg1541.1/GoldUCD/D3Y31
MADLEPGTECVASYSFKGATGKDLPFTSGELLFILSATKDPNWFYARRQSDKREGLIPANYVLKRKAMSLHTMPWFFGKITREQSHNLLCDETVIGSFLVRESTNYPGDYVISVRSPKPAEPVEHYRIEPMKGMLTVDKETFFSDLMKVVEFYSAADRGLCTRLTVPLRKDKHKEISTSVFIETFKKGGWVVKWDDISQQLEVIGSGEFAVVYKGTYKGQDVAIKKLKDDSEAAQSFLSEASVMTTLRHKNLVQFQGICFQGKDIYILTEFCEKGALVDYLRSRGRAAITQDQQRGFASDVCDGMSYLEKRKIVHRDLAARNVLLMEDMTAKVSDFGLAKNLDADSETDMLPVKWTAPEAIKHKRYSTESDVWSFGVLLWEIYSFGRNPYPRVPLKDVSAKVEKGYRMEIPDGCPNTIYVLMQRCWNLDPLRRPSFKSLKKELDNPPRETVL